MTNANKASTTQTRMTVSIRASLPVVGVARVALQGAQDPRFGRLDVDHLERTRIVIHPRVAPVAPHRLPGGGFIGEELETNRSDVEGPEVNAVESHGETSTSALMVEMNWSIGNSPATNRSAAIAPSEYGWLSPCVSRSSRSTALVASIPGRPWLLWPPASASRWASSGSAASASTRSNARPACHAAWSSGPAWRHAVSMRETVLLLRPVSRA